MKFKMEKKVIILAIIIILIILLAWAPWITTNYAEERAVNAFESKQEGIVDGCGFNCEGCGIKSSHRSLFGYSVEIEYACGLLPADTEEYHTKDSIFVSAFGTVHSL